MLRFRVVEAGGPIRDVAVETTTTRLAKACARNPPQSLPRTSQWSSTTTETTAELVQSDHGGQTAQSGSSRCAHAELANSART